MTVVPAGRALPQRDVEPLATEVRSTDYELQVDLADGGRWEYTYDAAGRLATLRNLRPDDSVLSSYRYLLDPTGNRVGLIEADGSRTT